MHAAERLAESALHRMSQPVTAIRCLLEFALEQDEPEILRDFAQRSTQECTRVSAMLHAFRDLLLLGARSHDTESVELHELLQVTELARVPSAYRNKKQPQKQAAEGGEAGPERSAVFVGVNRTGLMSAAWHLRELLGVGADRDTFRNGIGEVERECVVTENMVCLRWSLAESTEKTVVKQAAWCSELEAINPFAIASYDFARNGIPRLTMIKTIAEAMGGDLLCNETSLELQLARVPVKSPTVGAETKVDATAPEPKWNEHLRGA